MGQYQWLGAEKFGRMSKPKKSIAKLKKELDFWFNSFVRSRDYNHGVGGGCFCISCGNWVPEGTGHASHFYAATFAKTRWDERNVNVSCVRCNVFLHGNLLGYCKGMREKYGQGVMDELEALHNQPFKLDRQWLEDKIRYYKDKLNNSI